MAKINLLPHREAKRKQRKHEFFVMLGISAVIGVLIVFAVGGYFANNISQQNHRNNVLKTANDDLDKKIKEIASLKQEIESLKARQQAVEDLQADRNQPVYLMDELVKQVPEGVYLRSFKQEGQRVALDGYAQSNERVSELLRNLSNNSPWLERPDLIVIHSVVLGQGRDAKNVFEFTINVGIKRPRDQDKLADKPANSGAAENVAANKTAAKQP